MMSRVSGSVHDRPAAVTAPGQSFRDCPDCSLIASRLASALAPATGNAILGLRFDWAATVAEVPPHLLAHSPAYFVGQRGQCLTSGTSAAFKGAVIGIERRQHKGMRLSMGLDVYETSLSEE